MKISYCLFRRQEDPHATLPHPLPSTLYTSPSLSPTSPLSCEKPYAHFKVKTPKTLPPLSSSLPVQHLTISILTRTNSTLSRLNYSPILVQGGTNRKEGI
jgi:hypothetical protein